MNWITKSLDITSIAPQHILLLTLVLAVVGILWLTFRFNKQSWQG